MASSFSSEIDPVLKKAVRLLHSSHPSSATELRLLLDELITQRFGEEKTVTKTLKKRFIEEENSFPGIIHTPPAPPIPSLTQPDQIDEVINLTHSPDAMSGAVTEGETNLKDFGDLNCCVCGEMMITASNRLIECSKCSTLYHQECHKPPITDEEASEGQECNWQCDNCYNKPTTSKAAMIAVPDDPVLVSSKSKTSAGSSRSSSPYFKNDSSVSITATPSSSQASGSSSSSSSKHHHHHHHRSSSSKTSSKSSKHHDGSSKRKSHK